MMSKDMFSARTSDGPMQVVDLLKNSSHLSKGVVVKDILTFNCDPRRIDPTITLPKRTLECYY